MQVKVFSRSLPAFNEIVIMLINGTSGLVIVMWLVMVYAYINYLFIAILFIYDRLGILSFGGLLKRGVR